jgi:hypothetical protein
VKTLTRPTDIISGEQTKATLWVQFAVTLGFNAVGLYVSHQITLHVWRAMTGH